MVAKIIHPLLSFVGIFLIAILVAIWVAVIVFTFIGLPFAGYASPGSMTTALGIFNILFVIGIPLLMMVLFIMRVFLRSNFRPKWQFGLWAFWVINVISLSMIAMMIVKDVQYGEEVSISSENYSVPTDTLLVEMERSPFQNSIFSIGDEFLISDDQLIARSIRVIFEKSPSDQVEVVMENESRGSSLLEAKRLAEGVDYNYYMEGNRLVLPSHFTIKKGEKWRDQTVYLTIKVPEGMYVKRNNALAHNIYDVKEDENYKFPWYRSSSQIWKMGPNGMVAPDYIAEYKKEFSFRDFSKIRVEGEIELNIKRGNNYSIILEESDSQGDVEVTRTDGRLDISTPNSNEPFKMEITMPQLEELWIIQSGDIEIKDFKMDNLHIVNEGDGHINVFADIQNLDVQLTGSNEFGIRGEGDYLNAILTNNAELDAEHFTVKKANLELDNGSLAKVSATDTLWKKVIDGEVISRRAPVMIEKN